MSDRIEPPRVRCAFVTQVHTDGSRSIGEPRAPENQATSRLCPVNAHIHTVLSINPEHGKGSQTGWVPVTTPSCWQENVCSVSPTPSTLPGAHLAVRVSPQSLTQSSPGSVHKNTYPQHSPARRCTKDSHWSTRGSSSPGCATRTHNQRCRARPQTCWSLPPN